jgi:hypothetical protein
MSRISEEEKYQPRGNHSNPDGDGNSKVVEADIMEKRPGLDAFSRWTREGMLIDGMRYE